MAKHGKNSNEKVTVRWMPYHAIDFGMLNDEYKAGEFEVDQNVWTDYCNKRLEFEIMHKDLLDKISNQARYKKLIRELNSTDRLKAPRLL